MVECHTCFLFFFHFLNTLICKRLSEFYRFLFFYFFSAQLVGQDVLSKTVALFGYQKLEHIVQH